MSWLESIFGVDPFYKKRCHEIAQSSVDESIKRIEAEVRLENIESILSFNDTDDKEKIRQIRGIMMTDEEFLNSMRGNLE